MLSKLTTQYIRQTQYVLIGLAICSATTALLFDSGRIAVRLAYVGASFLVFPVTYGMMWLILMLHIWIRIAPKIFLRFASNFFFICSIIASLVAFLLPIIAKDSEQPGSSALMAASALGFGFGAFNVYKKPLIPTSSAT